MSKKQDGEVERVIVTKELTFKLTEKEIAQKGKSAAESKTRLTEKNHEFENVKQKYKGEIGAIECELSDHLSTIKRGTEDRTVECTMVKDFSRHVVEYVYNGEIMEERPMTMDERQPELLPSRRATPAPETTASQATN